jgi:hypothetical protein
MSQDRYFEKFPLIKYNDSAAVDITKRIVFLNNVLKNPYLFYPYEIVADERADQFSHRYYDDSYKSWVIYLSNQIIDPYYEWYMEDNAFNEFIVKKYGSFELATNRIKHYECNWENGETISISRYDSLLPTIKRYWEPDVQGSKIIQYKRKKIDQIYNTNKLVKYDVNGSASLFKNGEICKLTSTDNNISGKGQISAIIDNVIYLQHVSGDSIFEIEGSDYHYYITGLESNASATITSSVLIQNNFMLEEEIYWYPISYYQYEYNRNAYNKTIKVLDKSYAKLVADNLESAMK